MAAASGTFRSWTSVPLGYSCDDIEDLDTQMGGGEVLEFEVRFKAKRIWSQPMEDDRSYLTGWKIEQVSE